MEPLLDEQALADSSVVANCCMNRERGCEGGNSYAQELGFSPLTFLRQRLEDHPSVHWLDLCCGTGKALIEAAITCEAQSKADCVQITGVDLVSYFHPSAASHPFLSLQIANLAHWQAPDKYDLITCVHGLHYVGDKLGLIERAAAWLKSDGLLIAHLDAANLCWADGSSAGKAILRRLRTLGFEYATRKHLLSLRGGRTVQSGLRFVGANDAAGANYTRQAAVNSHYEMPL